MRISIQERVSFLAGLILLALCFASSVFSDDNRYIFDWRSPMPPQYGEITPTPHANHWPQDWEQCYDDQYASGGFISLLLKECTRPLDGAIDKETLHEVMDYLNTSGYYLDFVFADFEDYTNDNCDANCVEMVSQVRNHANSAINNAYIGNYAQCPGATDYSLLDSSRVCDRTDRHNFYMNSGLNVAMPVMYPYTAYRNHAVLYPSPCVSIAHALFWAPLERYSTAKRALPAGHLCIPWMGGLVWNTGYEAPIPSRTECRALLQHARLRGADGYYAFVPMANTNYENDGLDYSHDIYDYGWKPLNWFFDYPGEGQILNLTTNRTGGVEWSGMRKGNRCLFAFSNYTDSSAQVPLPQEIENLPALSPSIASGGHMIMDYVVGPSAYWKLNENAGAITYDEKDGGYDGTLSGSIWSSGKFGSALTFDGNDSVSFGDVLDLGTSDRTISLWFKTNTTSEGAILSKGYGCALNQHAVYIQSNGKLTCLMDVSGTDRIVHSGTAVNDGMWHHAVVTIQRNDKMKLYLDGVFKMEVSIVADSAVNAQNTYNLYLGRSHYGQYFNGSIDEVKIFSSVLSEQEVFDEYFSILNSRLDEGTGTSVSDESPMVNPGTVTGATWLIPGKFGSALAFDGNDSVSFGDVLDMGTSDRTISLWFKTTTTSEGAILSKGYGCALNQHAVYIQSNGKLTCLMDVSGTDRIVHSGTAVNDGLWHHVAVTIQRNDKMKLYLDGAFKMEVSITADSAVDAQNTYNLYFGRSHYGQYFNGSIDEVKIYNKALNATEVSALCESYN